MSLIEVLARNSGTCRFGGTIKRRLVQSKRGMEYAGSGLCMGKFKQQICKSKYWKAEHRGGAFRSSEEAW